MKKIIVIPIILLLIMIVLTYLVTKSILASKDLIIRQDEEIEKLIYEQENIQLLLEDKQEEFITLQNQFGNLKNEQETISNQNVRVKEENNKLKKVVESFNNQNDKIFFYALLLGDIETALASYISPDESTDANSMILASNYLQDYFDIDLNVSLSQNKEFIKISEEISSKGIIQLLDERGNLVKGLQKINYVEFIISRITESITKNDPEIMTSIAGGEFLASTKEAQLLIDQVREDTGNSIIHELVDLNLQEEDYLFRLSEVHYIRIKLYDGGGDMSLIAK